LSGSDPDTPFAIRDFRLFWATRLSSGTAQNCMIVAIGWQVYNLARAHMGIRDASLQLGLIGLAQFVPLCALTLVTGWVADRFDRRLVALLCLTLQTLCAASLFLLNLHGSMGLSPLFVVAVLLGIGRAFSQPTLNALAPNLVPARVLPRAIAANAIASRIGSILGPAMAGYLYAAAPYVPYAVSLGLFLLSIGALSTVHPLVRIVIDNPRKPWRLMMEGLRYVRYNPLVLGAISLDLFAVLLGGATAMLPVYAQDILRTGASGLGHLRAAPAVGATVTAVIFSYWPLKHDVGVKMLVGVAVFGLATVVFGLSRWMPLSLASLVVLGAADMFSVYIRQSLIQIGTPNEMRGRIGAVSTLFISASNELGEAESGFLAAMIGPVAAVVAGGLGAIAVTALWAKWFPALRLAREFGDIRPVTVPEAAVKSEPS
jgi:MFS family permease